MQGTRVVARHRQEPDSSKSQCRSTFFFPRGEKANEKTSKDTAEEPPVKHCQAMTRWKMKRAIRGSNKSVTIPFFFLGGLILLAVSFFSFSKCPCVQACLRACVPSASWQPFGRDSTDQSFSTPLKTLRYASSNASPRPLVMRWKRRAKEREEGRWLSLYILILYVILFSVNFNLDR